MSPVLGGAKSGQRISGSGEMEVGGNGTIRESPWLADDALTGPGTASGGRDGE